LRNESVKSTNSEKDNIYMLYGSGDGVCTSAGLSAGILTVGVRFVFD
jgi:hypothetical protein